MPEVPDEEFLNIGNMKSTMEKIKATKTVIVWVFVMAPLYFKVVREAYAYVPLDCAQICSVSAS